MMVETILGVALAVMLTSMAILVAIFTGSLLFMMARGVMDERDITYYF